MTSGAGLLVLPMRRATRAAAAIVMAPTSRAWWYPASAATEGDTRPAIRWSVRVIATAERMARPSALPICWDEFSSPAARPAWSDGTPALAAAVTETNTDPAPSDITRNPGSRSLGYEPCRGTLDTYQIPAAATRQPATTTGRVPMRVTSCEARPPATANPAVIGR